jgi:tetratricopeptide (TPR) repeat protein
LRLLGPVSEIETAELARMPMDSRGYALAWAAAYQLFPGYEAGQAWPARIKLGSFVLRRRMLDLPIPNAEIRPLSEVEREEFLAALQVRVPQSPGARAEVAEADSLFLEGLRLSDEGRLPEAIPLLEQACRRRPSNSSWWLALAMAYRESGRVADAAGPAQRAVAVAINPTERSAAEAFLQSLEKP